jgi:hypothetical protein
MTPQELARRGTAYQMMSAAARGHSRTAWVDINSMLHDCLWFIVGTVRPAMHEMEIGLISADFKGGYWFGENGDENLYALAIRAGHPTAPASVEYMLNRAPFWIEEDGEKHRLYVGRIFTFNGERLRVTSFFEHGVRCVRDGDGVKSGVVEVLREGLEAEREAVRKARLDAAKKERDAGRADPVPLRPLAEHLEWEMPRILERGYTRSRHVPPDFIRWAKDYGGDYKRAYAEIPCTYALGWYLEAIGLRSNGRHRGSDVDQMRKNYPWSKVEQHLYRRLRDLRGLPLKDAK